MEQLCRTEPASQGMFGEVQKEETRGGPGDRQGSTAFGSQKVSQAAVLGRRVVQSSQSTSASGRMEISGQRGRGDVQVSARKDVVLGAARVYTVAVPGPKWKSWLECFLSALVEGRKCCSTEARQALRRKNAVAGSKSPAGYILTRAGESIMEIPAHNSP